MNRRTFLQTGLAAGLASRLDAHVQNQRFDAAVEILQKAVSLETVASAVLHVVQRGAAFSQAFGEAKDDRAMFLLGSITKPICVTALMTLFDKKAFALDDRLQKFLPQFQGEGRDDVTILHLLTHTSGLPDQLTKNNELRQSHAPLPTFVEHAVRTPLSFAPGSRYQYSSMGILLALEAARVISGVGILDLVDQTVFQPAGMKRSALGIGRFALGDFVSSQTKFGAPEAGGGDPSAKDWDWNSSYWRKLGAPWGGGHASAPDLATFLAEFLAEKGHVVKPETARLMTTNRNRSGLTPRGLGFAVGAGAGSRGCSERTFGHTGSTGTLAWADPETETICVVLTSLPGGAIQPHPREAAATAVANAIRR